MLVALSAKLISYATQEAIADHHCLFVTTVLATCPFCVEQYIEYQVRFFDEGLWNKSLSVAG